MARLLVFFGKAADVDDEETTDTADGGFAEDGVEDQPDSTSDGESTTGEDSTTSGDSAAKEESICDSVSQNLTTLCFTDATLHSLLY